MRDWDQWEELYAHLLTDVEIQRDCSVVDISLAFPEFSVWIVPTDDDPFVYHIAEMDNTHLLVFEHSPVRRRRVQHRLAVRYFNPMDPDVIGTKRQSCCRLSPSIPGGGPPHLKVLVLSPPVELLPH